MILIFVKLWQVIFFKINLALTDFHILKKLVLASQVARLTMR
jgi:hypothetical protein